ncbi:hypothetical protein D3C86_2168450 [compost metagenome]
MSAKWICPQITPCTPVSLASCTSASSKRPITETAFFTFCLAEALSDQYCSPSRRRTQLMAMFTRNAKL